MGRNVTLQFLHVCNIFCSLALFPAGHTHCSEISHYSLSITMHRIGTIIKYYNVSSNNQDIVYIHSYILAARTAITGLMDLQF
ncbi:hypothetical protein FKM82_018529 [Ascaphus truei]